MTRQKHIGSYFSVNGEFPTESINQFLHSLNKSIYAPVIENQSVMKFRKFGPGSRMTLNRFQIPEPDSKEPLLKAVDLDFILMPVVGFDNHGNRIGMGGGFYDRSLAALKQGQDEVRPYLLGVAFDCQKLDLIEPQLWDIPLDAILTESGIQIF